ARRVEDLHGGRRDHHAWLLSGRYRAGAAIPPQQADWLEAGLATAPLSLPVLTPYLRRHGPTLRPRSFARRLRRVGGGVATEFARSRAARRPARIQALLGGGASQSAVGRELGAGDHDRSDRRR